MTTSKLPHNERRPPARSSSKDGRLPGTGRRKVLDNPAKPKPVRLERVTVTQLEQLAAQQGIKPARLMRQLIEEGVQKLLGETVDQPPQVRDLLITQASLSAFSPRLVRALRRVLYTHQLQDQYASQVRHLLQDLRHYATANKLSAEVMRVLEDQQRVGDFQSPDGLYDLSREYPPPRP